MKTPVSLSQRVYELLSSMRFAVSLLTLLGIASIIGTVLKQNEPYTNYIVKFGQFWFEMFEMLGLLDVYHAAWFLVILLFLVISTTLCVIRNAPLMIKEWQVYKENATEKSLRLFSHQASVPAQQSPALLQEKLGAFLTSERYRFKTQQHGNGDMLIAAKLGTHQRLGYIFTHVAIVVICFGGLLDGICLATWLAMLAISWSFRNIWRRCIKPVISISSSAGMRRYLNSSCTVSRMPETK